MTEQPKSATTKSAAQQVRRLLTPERVTQAEKTNALRGLQRAARRCAKHLGKGATRVLLEIVADEIGAGAR